MTKIVFLNDGGISSLSLGKKLFDYLSYSQKYHPLFSYMSNGYERVFGIDKTKYDILIDILPNMIIPINSDNIISIMSIMDVNFVSDMNCNFFLAEEEDLLYARLKNEESYLTLIDRCEDFSGNILDYIKKH